MAAFKIFFGTISFKKHEASLHQTYNQLLMTDKNWLSIYPARAGKAIIS
jgi:hypothetical protein